MTVLAMRSDTTSFPSSFPFFEGSTCHGFGKASHRDVARDTCC
jgi:hypothetical protein